jgi:4-amino-4-deoxy-L-arabinose transferase-like glycosyltransferase
MVALLLCLGSPIFFVYGHLDFKETGGAFFLTVGIFYLLRFLKSAELHHLNLCFFAVAAGYLMRRPSLIFLFVIPVFLLCDVWRKKRNGVSSNELKLLLFDEFVLLFIVLLVIFPWLYLTKEVRPYDFHIDNFLNLKTGFAYAKILPGSMTWPNLIFAFVGLVTAFWKRQIVGIVVVISFLLIYILFTGDEPYWIPVHRFTVLMVPPIALLAALSSKVMGKWRNHFLIFMIFSVCIHLGCWRFNFGKPWLFPGNTATFSSYPYYPFDQVMKAMTEKNIPAGNVLYPAFWQPASSVYYFYNDILDEYHDTIPGWKPSKERRCSIADLIARCEEITCKALILRLEKTGDSTKVEWLTDLPGEEVLADNVPGFQVIHLTFLRNHGLALLIPNKK